MTSDAPVTALIGLGANIPSDAGAPTKTLGAALVALAKAGVEITGLSPFYETTAWPDPNDPPFMNAVASLRTSLQPFALLTLLHEVETALGRKRSAPNAPRTLDLDLLDYAGQVLDGPVQLPHPRLAQRRFVLEPLQAVAPAWRHPVTGQRPSEMLRALDARPAG